MDIPLARPDITEKEIEAVVEVLNTPYLSMGPKVKLFEEHMKNFVGIKHAIAVNSGTSALHLAIRALDIKEGDEVITTPYTFISSANCILFERARPVFVDIDDKTLNIDPEKISEAITKKTKAILPVHVFGYPCEMDSIMSIADDFGLKVIEDSCEAIGGKYKNKFLGAIGDIGSFAFYPNKQITTGEGGMVVTNSDEIADSTRTMRNQGRDINDKWLDHSILGYNYRLSDINSALGIEQMKRLSGILEKREKVAKTYDGLLSSIKEIRSPLLGDKDHEPSWFVYTIRIDSDRINKNELMNYLNVNGVQCGNYFPSVHLQKLYRKLFGYKEGSFPISEKASSDSFAIPFFNNISEYEQNYVISTIEKGIKELLKD